MPFGFAPELNHYLEEVLGFPAALSEIRADFTQGLLEKNTASHCTLLSTANLQFFFERYAFGDFEAIRTRFFKSEFSEHSRPLSNDQIIGLHEYLRFLADTLLESGPEKAADWASYQAFGSWLSLTMRTSYNQVWEVVRQWAPTRYLAAMVSSQMKDCMGLVGSYIEDQAKAKVVCENNDFVFKNMSGIYYFALAPKDSSGSIKAELMARTNITAAEYAAIYNATDPDSLGALIGQTDALIAGAYNCSSAA